MKQQWIYKTRTVIFNRFIYLLLLTMKKIVISSYATTPSALHGAIHG